MRERYTICLEVTREQMDLLEEFSYAYDEGPNLDEGWQSDAMKELGEMIREKIDSEYNDPKYEVDI